MGMLYLFVAICFTQVSGQLYDPLYEHLMTTDHSATIPEVSLDVPLDVDLGLSLIKVKSINTETGDADLKIWLNYHWKDDRLAWNEGDYNNIKTLRVHPSHVWLPDIELYDGDMETSNSLAVLNSDGSIYHVPKGNINIRCDVSNFTDTQTVACTAKLGSWTYGGDVLKLNLLQDSIDLSSFKADRWQLESSSIKRNVLHYECCPEPYYDVTATMVFRDTKAKGRFSFFKK